PHPVPPPRPPPPFVPPRPRPTPPPVVLMPLELASHQVHARLRDQLAVTTVEQVIYNPNPRRLEGTFLFPLPKGAHINKFTMEIGGKPVEAELLAADKARRIYEDIVRSMKDPALLEYAGRDLLKARIFPIEPHERKRITLSYTQLLKNDTGLVSYSYPLNVEKFSAKPIKTFSLKVEVETKQPLKSIYSPSHTVEIKRDGDRRATIGFEASDTRADRDFQLYYAPEKDEIGLNLMTYRTGDGEGYFLLLAAPGVTADKKQVVPKDVAFVLDTSGSMAGNKLEQAKKALQFCVENLNAQDRFEVVRFSTEIESLFGGMVEATGDHRKRAREFVADLKPMGGTAIHEALQRGLALRPEQSERPFVIIFLTDGRPTIGITDEDSIVKSVEKFGQTRVFCFGIGTDVNTHLLDKITEKTRAFSQYVLAEEDIEVKVSNFFTKIKDPVLANPQLTFGGNVRVTKLYPSPLPDLFKGGQVVLAGRYTGKGDCAITLAGSVGGKEQKFTYETTFPERAAEHDFIPRLWATRRIGYLLDEIRLNGENAELREEVTELARAHGIVTPYTAYLIVEDEQRRGVPRTAQSLRQLGEDREAQGVAADAWRQVNTERSGGAAVSQSRLGLEFKAAESAESLTRANKEAARSLRLAAPTAPVMTAPAPAAAGRPMASVAARVDGVAQRMEDYRQQNRYVAGRSFFQNGEQWIDANVQKLANARRVRVQFNSSEYFDLIAKQPQAVPWLALGRQVQFELNGTVYEVYE
ncbi:MAG: VIT domain-containing protein, partial [Verrucomicrobiota bacterium]